MRKIVLLFTLVVVMAGISGIARAADTLDDVRKRGVLRAGVKDLTPGFALADLNGEIKGYDIDIVRAIAQKLGVKLAIIPVKEMERISTLMENKVDILAATLTKTEERAKDIDFSYAYFVTAQKFLVRKGSVKSLADLKDKKIGTVAGTTSEINVRKALPEATIVLFPDYVPAFLAVQRGELFAITTDEAMLAAILAKTDKGYYEIPEFAISTEPYGLGIRKGNPSFLLVVNQTLLDMEENGEANRIYDRWFGPKSPMPLKRAFTIAPK
ncbi:MAG: ABC transporter glutamine-binding protein GlnH [Syntrophus sp. SKADARSKE-3]|nr:ABC transporter glutamine-binding protein GlnH [Syntrophus sp. SKADARSKE-3]